ncbi:MAG: oxidoreductase [Bdellovibrionales bacterium CG10_big_fil_rev_8_21_14_0_10_45_34]|nr:MAG: oxidoreductase [Bdellovibrionales bacterium CG10_big_fil_rev_8_21_14_0_10_45_34]
MNATDKLKFALIGCGRIAGKHVDALTALEGASLVAVCDIKFERAKAIADKLNIPAYRDYNEMLQKEQIDVVNILTESGTHAKLAVAVAEHKKHVVVEKPMALTLSDADAMIQACDRNRVKLFVVKQNRYNKPVKKLREAVESGRFGKLVLGTVRVRWCRRQEYYDQDAWRGTWAMDGGVFTNQASHHIDLLEWMMGEVVSVFAKTSTQLVDIETEDTGVAVLKFASGALGVVEATTATRPKDLEGSLSILGEKGSVEISGFAVNEMRTWQFTDLAEDDLKTMKEHNQNPPNVYGFGHFEYLKDVIDSVVNNKKALVDGLVGRKSLELINAIYESAETGKEVFLRFQPRLSRLGQHSLVENKLEN